MRNESSDDLMWQEIINRSMLYLTDEGDDDDGYGGDEFLFSMASVPASRLKYKPVGM